MARRIVRLDAADARAYRSVVEPLVPAIERTLGPEVLASRAWGRGDVPTTGLEPWRPARRAWRGALRAALEEDPGAVLVADVRRCYESIRPDALGDRLRAMGISSTWTRDVLERLEGLEGAGLPVGPAPSAVLANAVLGALDEALREAGVPHVRWVDDVVAFAGGRREAVTALDALRRGMDLVGLELNVSKTGILQDRGRMRERLFRRQPSTAGSDPVR